MPYNAFTPATAAAAPATTVGNPLTSVGETLSSLQSTLLEELSGRTDATAARLTKWINYGYRQLVGMLDLPQLWGSVSFSFVASQPFYLVPNAVAWSRQFLVVDSDTYGTDVGGIILKAIDLDAYRTLDDLTDEPRQFLFTGASPSALQMAVIYPTPLNARTAIMDFRVRPASLSAATDSPILPQEFHEGLMLLAKAKAMRQFRLVAESKEAYNEALAIIRPLINTAAEENANIPATLTPLGDFPEYYRSSRW